MASHCVFLSPHRDDACFSTCIPAFHLGGTIINFFTKSQHTVSTADDFSPATIAEVSRLRRGEDARFLAECGLTEIDMGWPEAPLRGVEPFKATQANLRDGQQSFADAILQELITLVGRTHGGEWHLFCPLGIREHADHVIVRNTVLKFHSLISRHFKIHFYEEMPYAARKELREPAIDRLKDNPITHDFTRWTLPLEGWEHLKLRLISIYSSQFEELPRSLDGFSPSCDGLGPHEAVWTRDPDDLTKLMAAPCR